MENNFANPATFSCAMEVPVMAGGDHHTCIPVICVFRASIASDSVDHWVVKSDGTPRSDRELATEVLVEIRKPPDASGQMESRALSARAILKSDAAAAIVVSTYLSVLPRGTGRHWKMVESSADDLARPP